VAENEIPSETTVKRFFTIVDGFIRSNPDESLAFCEFSYCTVAFLEKIIGVHCFDGVDCTGFMICRYLNARFEIPMNIAIDAFNAARGHNMKESFKMALLFPSVPLLPQMPIITEQPTVEPEASPEEQTSNLPKAYAIPSPSKKHENNDGSNIRSSGKRRRRHHHHKRHKKSHKKRRRRSSSGSSRTSSASGESLEEGEIRSDEEKEAEKDLYYPPADPAPSTLHNSRLADAGTAVGAPPLLPPPPMFDQFLALKPAVSYFDGTKEVFEYGLPTAAVDEKNSTLLENDSETNSKASPHHLDDNRDDEEKRSRESSDGPGNANRSQKRRERRRKTHQKFEVMRSGKFWKINEMMKTEHRHH